MLLCYLRNKKQVYVLTISHRVQLGAISLLWGKNLTIGICLGKILSGLMRNFFGIVSVARM